MREALDDAGLQPEDIQYINAHGTSTPKGDSTEIKCLRRFSGKKSRIFPFLPTNPSWAHAGATAAIEAALTIEGMRRGIILPTIIHIPDPELTDIDVVPNAARKQKYEIALSNAFGFGGTNCCVIPRSLKMKPKPFKPEILLSDANYVRDSTTGYVWHLLTAAYTICRYGSLGSRLSCQLLAVF